MIFKIVDINFTTKYEWLFRFSDEFGNESYIMNESFYKNHNLISPITKQHLDYLDKGQHINVVIECIENKEIVTKINW